MSDEQAHSETNPESKPAETPPTNGAQPIISEPAGQSVPITIGKPAEPEASEPAPEPANRLQTVWTMENLPAVVTPGQCPICLKSGLKNVAVHMRVAHIKNPSKGAAAQPRRPAAPAAGQQEPPPPDFSDIDGANVAPQPAPLNPSAVSPDARFETMATMSFDMTTNILARFLGPEWLADEKTPEGKAERATVILAAKKYFQSLNMPDIPPGYVLCFVCLAYAAPRLNAQPTKTKLQAAWFWVKSKFIRKRSIPVIRIAPEPTKEP